METPDRPDSLHTTVHDRRTVYDNRWVRVDLAEIEPPDGRRFEHHVVTMDHVAIAVLLDKQDRVLMLWRYRFAVDQWGYELLGGIVEAGEESAATAAREAEEESGYRPVGSPEHIASFQPMPGMVDAPVDIYLWREFEQVGEPSDPEEAALMRWISVADLPELVAGQEVLGAGTLVAVLHLVAKYGSAVLGN